MRNLAVMIAMAFSGAAMAQDQSQPEHDERVQLESVTILGSAGEGQQVTGSAQVINEVELARFKYTDVQRILRSVPGVSIQVEDGYGLRPNLSIRGVATERSGRITLLEDNVLIAPAPYAASSAYYFPTAARMHGFEVLKGPAAITQGPYTIGGALNMISTPVASQTQGQIEFEAGEDSTYRLHANYGDSNDGFSYLVETHQWQSDGFQDIDRTSNHTGLDVEDYMVKLRFEPADPAKRHQRLDIKLQYTSQDSEQSYLGLTDADFDRDPFRRYGLSALDSIATTHRQAIVRYDLDLNNRWSASATLYGNDHKRDWFKTEGLDIDGSSDAQSFDRISWFNVVQAVNGGTGIGGLDTSRLQGILDGDDTAIGSIQLRSNNREYYSRGVQLGLIGQLATGAIRHELEFGLRYHEDEEDRLQRNSTYHQQAGQLVLDDLGLLGNAGNQIQDADALAFYAYDRIEFDRWVLTPGLRYEDIDQSRIRYETRPGRTSDPSGRSPSDLRDSRQNKTDVWLPGMGVLYRASSSMALVGGVHKGFTAPSNSPSAREEEALNYELGFRFNNGRMRAEVMGYFSDYENLVGECTASSGADCEVGDAFNGDAATVRGVEILMGTDLFVGDSYRVPLQLSYTHTDAEFDTDIANTEFFGDVSAGDPIPYIPDNQLQAVIGLENSVWAINLSANYVDEVCVRASCERFERTDDTLIWDLSGNYRISETLSVFARLENLSAEEDLLARHPYGARPNKARTAALGIRLAF